MTVTLAHFGDAERQEMVKQLVMGHLGGRDTLRSMIRTNRKAKRRRAQFEFPETAPPPPPLKVVRNIKQELQDTVPVHINIHACYEPTTTPSPQPSPLPPSPAAPPRSVSISALRLRTSLHTVAKNATYYRFAFSLAYSCTFMEMFLSGVIGWLSK